MPTTRTTARHAASKSSKSLPQTSSTDALLPPPSGLLPSFLPGSQGDTHSQFSFLSSSTAPLPRSHRISVALPPKHQLDWDEGRDLWVQGQEALTDAWRRLGEKEGRLEDVLERKRARRGRVGHAKAQSDTEPNRSISKDDVLWYTAGLRYGCTCQLGKLTRGWSIRQKVPRGQDLSNLGPEPTSQVPQVGEAIPDWAPTDDQTDLDPGLDQLQEFEYYSQPAAGPSKLSKTRLAPPSRDIGGHGSTRAAEERAEDSLAESSASTVLFPSQLSQIAFDRKSKGKATVPNTDDFSDRMPPRSALVASQRAITHSTPVVRPDLLALDRARKAAWRARIASDASSGGLGSGPCSGSGSYGRVFNLLPRPHSLEPYPSTLPAHGATGQLETDPPRPASFVLPRFYTAPPPSHSHSPSHSRLSHPYHPSLAAYIRQRPHARVHWIVPVHGPVLLAAPHCGPGQVEAGLDSRVPLPSAGRLLDSLTLPLPSDPPKSPTGLTWTPALLKHFWSAFLLPLHHGRLFHPLSIRLSGPKPDPFIDLPLAPGARWGLEKHVALPMTDVDGRRDRGSDRDRNPAMDTGAAALAPAKRTRKKQQEQEQEQEQERGLEHKHGSATLPAPPAPPAPPGPTSTPTPVRAETGDHIRLYVDARWALNLRLWLYGVEVDLGALGALGVHAHGGLAGPVGTGVDAQLWRPFARQRLALVGERGEVLVVA